MVSGVESDRLGDGTVQPRFLAKLRMAAFRNDGPALRGGLTITAGRPGIFDLTKTMADRRSEIDECGYDCERSFFGNGGRVNSKDVARLWARGRFLIGSMQ